MNARGEFKVLDLLIKPNLNLQDFKNSELGKKAKKKTQFGDFESYLIEDYTIFNRTFSPVLMFAKSCISSIQFYSEDESKGWGEYSSSDEKNKKKRNDELLQKILGDPPYNFGWGNIESIYDQKAGYSYIIINYV